MAKKESQKLDIAGMSPEQAMEVLNSVYGANTFVPAAKALGSNLVFYSTGAYAMDFALGGGIPANRITELYGEYSSFKTTVLLLSIASFQRQHKDGLAIYCDMERTFDRSYAKLLGCDLRRLWIQDPDGGEHAIDSLNKAMQMRIPLFVGIDSIAALRPIKESDDSMEQQTMGVHARFIARSMVILNSRLKRDLYDPSAPPLTVVCLNQVREKIGVVYGNPETTPGGRTKDFYYSVTVRLSATKSSEIGEDKTVNGIKRHVRVGQTVSFKVRKNKTGGPQNEEGSFDFYFKPRNGVSAFTVDNAEALFHYGLFFGVLGHSSDKGYIYKADGKIIIPRKKRESDFKKALRELDEDQTDTLYWAILDAVKASVTNANSEDSE